MSQGSAKTVRVHFLVVPAVKSENRGQVRLFDQPRVLRESWGQSRDKGTEAIKSERVPPSPLLLLCRWNPGEGKQGAERTFLKRAQWKVDSDPCFTVLHKERSTRFRLVSIVRLWAWNQAARF